MKKLKSKVKNIRENLHIFLRSIRGLPPWSDKAILAMEVSGFCNLRCPMCSYPKMKREKGFMDWGLFCKIVEDAAANGHDIASLHFFGEPLLWPHIVEGVRLLSSKNIYPRISTNGMLLTGEMARNLQDAGLKEIMVTIDTLNPDVYTRIRTGGNLETVKNNIHQAIHVAPNLLISAQFMPTSENSDEKAEDFYKEFGEASNFKVEPWFVIRMNNSESLSKEFTHSPSEVDKRMCNKTIDRLDVLWDGTTVLCCLDSEGKLVTGNLNNNSIAYSWLGPKAMKLRKTILNGDWDQLVTCRECSADHIVSGRTDWKMFENKPLPFKYRMLLKNIECLGSYDSSAEKWTQK